MSDATRKLADWCDEVEQQHGIRDHFVCAYCRQANPCHALQGARAVRAALLVSREPLASLAIALTLMAAALEEQ